MTKRLAVCRVTGPDEQESFSVTVPTVGLLRFFRLKSPWRNMQGSYENLF